MVSISSTRDNASGDDISKSVDKSIEGINILLHPTHPRHLTCVINSPMEDVDMSSLSPNETTVDESSSGHKIMTKDTHISHIEDVGDQVEILLLPPQQVRGSQQIQQCSEERGQVAPNVLSKILYQKSENSDGMPFTLTTDELSEIYKVKSYSEIMSEIQPLDYILFHGNDWISHTICGIEKSVIGNGDFSHVEVVVNSELLSSIPQLKPGRYYILGSESTISGPDDQKDIRGDGHFGVQIRDLELVVASYEQDEGATVTWCKNRDNLYVKDKKKAIERIELLHGKFGDRTYEWNLFYLLASAYEWLRPTRLVFEEIVTDTYHFLSTIGIAKDKTLEDVQNRRMFCSKLATLIGQAVENIPLSVIPENIVPTEFLFPREDTFERFLDDPIIMIP